MFLALTHRSIAKREQTYVVILTPGVAIDGRLSYLSGSEIQTSSVRFCLWGDNPNLICDNKLFGVALEAS